MLTFGHLGAASVNFAVSSDPLRRDDAIRLIELIKALRQDRTLLPSRELEDVYAFARLAEYGAFLNGLTELGFVCDDLAPDFPLDQANAQPTRFFSAATAGQVRHFFHMVSRAERWNSEYPTHVLTAVQSGALERAGRRLLEMADQLPLGSRNPK